MRSHTREAAVGDIEVAWVERRRRSIRHLARAPVTNENDRRASANSNIGWCGRRDYNGENVGHAVCVETTKASDLTQSWAVLNICMLSQLDTVHFSFKMTGVRLIKQVQPPGLPPLGRITDVEWKILVEHLVPVYPS